MTQSGLSRQKTKLKMIFSFLVLTVLIASIGISIVPSINVNGQNSSTGVTNHDPIQIHGNDDFTTENGVTGGSGTKNDPYIIENWDIDGTTTRIGIQIQYTDAYFTIRNCIIHHGGGWDSHGIYLYNVKNGNIENCEIYAFCWGISSFWGYTKNIQISSCSIHNNDDGVYLSDSDNARITDCEIYNNGDGVDLSYCSDITIDNCNIYNNSGFGGGYGIHLSCCSDTNITHCQVSENMYGISTDPFFGAGCSMTEIHYCDIYKNTEYGVYNGAIGEEYKFNATHCWWGSTDGPSKRGPGNGDNISANVAYAPYLTSSVKGVDGGTSGGILGESGEVLLYILVPIIIILIVVGVVLGIIKRGVKSPWVPSRPSPQKQQWAQQGPQQPTPPMPSQQHACPLCGQPLRYISEYQRWWCDNCKRYA